MKDLKKGKIRWFDATRGEGLVREDDSGQSYILHFTAIEGISRNNYQWPLEEDQKKLEDIKEKSVEFSLNDDETQVDFLKFL